MVGPDGDGECGRPLRLVDDRHGRGGGPIGRPSQRRSCSVRNRPCPHGAPTGGCSEPRVVCGLVVHQHLRAEFSRHRRDRGRRPEDVGPGRRNDERLPRRGADGGGPAGQRVTGGGHVGRSGEGRPLRRDDRQHAGTHVHVHGQLGGQLERPGRRPGAVGQRQPISGGQAASGRRRERRPAARLGIDRHGPAGPRHQPERALGPASLVDGRRPGNNPRRCYRRSPRPARRCRRPGACRRPRSPSR